MLQTAVPDSVQILHNEFMKKIQDYIRIVTNAEFTVGYRSSIEDLESLNKKFSDISVHYLEILKKL